jgi:hypothetical protein
MIDNWILKAFKDLFQYMDAAAYYFWENMAPSGKERWAPTGSRRSYPAILQLENVQESFLSYCSQYGRFRWRRRSPPMHEELSSCRSRAQRQRLPQLPNRHGS